MQTIRGSVAGREAGGAHRAVRLIALAAIICGAGLAASIQKTDAQSISTLQGTVFTHVHQEYREDIEDLLVPEQRRAARQLEAEKSPTGSMQFIWGYGTTTLSEGTEVTYTDRENTFWGQNAVVDSFVKFPGNSLNWLIQVTPTAEGTFKFGMNKGRILFSFDHAGRTIDAQNGEWGGNREIEYTPGPPTPIWTGFVSDNTYTADRADNTNAAGPFNVGDNIDIAVSFSEVVRASGSPSSGSLKQHVVFSIDGEERRAQLADIPDNNDRPYLIFRYTVTRSDANRGLDDGGKLVIKSLVAPPGTRITNSAQSSVTEDASLLMPPRALRVVREVAAAPPDSFPMVSPGEKVSWSVIFDRPLMTEVRSHRPYLMLDVTNQDMTTSTVNAAYDNDLNPSAPPNTLIFSYTVGSSVEPGTDFVLHNQHLAMSRSAGVNGFWVVDADTGAAIQTLMPNPDVLYTASADLREGQSVTYLTNLSPPNEVTAAFTANKPGLVAISPAEAVFIASEVDQQITVTAPQDADGAAPGSVEVTAVLSTEAMAADSYLDGNTFARWTFNILEDDPTIASLTTTHPRLSAGASALFSVVAGSVPLSGREVTMTVTEQGIDSCIDAARLTDADDQTDGIQLRRSLTVAGTYIFTVHTLAEFDGDCVITAGLTPPSDLSGERYFATSSGSALTAAVTVTGTPVGPEPPTRVFPPQNFAFTLRVDDSDGVVMPGALLTVSADLTYTGGLYRDPLDMTNGRLHLLNADHIWSQSGQRSLALPRSPQRCEFVTVGAVTSWTCKITFAAGANQIEVPIGTDPGSIPILGSVNVNGRTFSDRLNIEVRDKIDEVSTVSLDFAVDEEGERYPSSIQSGQSTRLLLSILNENSTASSPDGIAAITISASAGGLSAGIGGQMKEIGCPAGGLSCQISIEALTFEDADNLILTIAHPGPGKTGSADVRATVIDNEGESFLTEPITVSFLGGGEVLMISEPRGGVYYLGTPDADDEDAELDNRDLLTLSVSAVDAGGSRVDVPAAGRRWTITGPDGRSVGRGKISVAWPKGGASPLLDDAGRLQVEIDVDSDAPLAAGTYTLELRAGEISAERTFEVVSGTGSLTLSGPSAPPSVGDTITVSAEILDGGGSPVSDGTPLRWSSGSPSGAAVLIQISGGAAAVNGAASARFFVLGAGTAFVRAESGETADVFHTTVAGAEDEAPAPDYREFIRGCDPSSWLGDPISVSALFDGLASYQVTSIYRWTPAGWVRYGRHYAPGQPTHGRLIPGSEGFQIPTGAVLSVAMAGGICPFPPPGA